jgi:hypothetical protein
MRATSPTGGDASTEERSDVATQSNPLVVGKRAQLQSPESTPESTTTKGWQRVTDVEGISWYENVDGRTQWEQPLDYTEPSEGSTRVEGSDLPAGWTRVSDDGAVWFEHEDGRVQWERP